MKRYNHLNVKPWIFWPRRPQLVEKLLEEYPILSYDKREIESIFIGNFENRVQEKYRNNQSFDNNQVRDLSSLIYHSNYFEDV